MALTIIESLALQTINGATPAEIVNGSMTDYREAHSIINVRLIKAMIAGDNSRREYPADSLARW